MRKNFIRRAALLLCGILFVFSVGIYIIASAEEIPPPIDITTPSATASSSVTGAPTVTLAPAPTPPPTIPPISTPGTGEDSVATPPPVTDSTTATPEVLQTPLPEYVEQMQDTQKNIFERVKEILTKIKEVATNIAKIVGAIFDGTIWDLILEHWAKLIFDGFKNIALSLSVETSGFDAVTRSPAVQILLNFAKRFGFTLWIIGALFAVMEALLHYKNGDSIYAMSRDVCFNLLKSYLAVRLFAVIPLPLFKLSLDIVSTITASLLTSGSLTAWFATGFSHLFSAEGLLLSVIFIIIWLVSSIKVFLAHIERAGCLVILCFVGSLHMWSIPRGYWDPFWSWCKQVIAICFTTVCQLTLYTAALSLFTFGVGSGASETTLFFGATSLMLASTKVPQIADRFGMDTSIKGIGQSVQTIASTVRLAMAV